MKLLQIGLLLSILVVGALVFWKAQDTSTVSNDVVLDNNVSDKNASDNNASDNNASDPIVQDLIKERAHLDETVWAQEITAQEYEEVFVRLWDRLRKEDDAYAILADLPFDDLKFPALKVASVIEAGIRILASQGDMRRYDQVTWKEFLDQSKARGYELVESEWHHQDFTALESGLMQSKVSMTLHIAQASKQERFIVKGMLHVTWSKRSDATGYHIPQSIRVENLRAYGRQGTPIFKEVATLAATSDIQPILVQDLDGNGFADIVLAGCNAVYWNQGAAVFKRTDLCKFPTRGVKAGLLADLTGDGIVDLLTASENDYPLLYRGSPGGKFEDPGTALQLPQPLRTPQAITAGDVDGDGDLDLWLAQYRPPYLEGQMPTPYWDANDGWPSYFLRNDGEGNFVDATSEVGLAAKRYRRTYSNSFVDLDEDSDLDLLVASDFSGLDIYWNDGAGHFQDVTKKVIDETANFGMSHTFGDFNQDGRLDFFVLGMSSTTARRLTSMGLGRDEFPEHQENRMRMGYGNRMYLGRDGSQFRQAEFNDQLARSGWSWGVTNFDFDNDGDLDLYVSNGHQSRESAKDYCTRFWCHDIYSADSKPDKSTASFFDDIIIEMAQEGVSWNGFEHNNFFFNSRDHGFMNVHYLFDVGFEFDSRAVISEDLDNDGKVDLLVVEAESLIPGTPRGERLHILKNGWSGRGNWVGVELRNEPGQPSPEGAKIVVTQAGGRKRRTQIVTGDSFRAQHSLRQHFGLGEATSVERIDIVFTDGSRRRIDNPAINEYHSLP